MSEENKSPFEWYISITSIVEKVAKKHGLSMEEMRKLLLEKEE